MCMFPGFEALGCDDALSVVEGGGAEEGLEAVFFFGAGDEGGVEGLETGGDVDALVSEGRSIYVVREVYSEVWARLVGLTLLPTQYGQSKVT